MAEPIRIKLDTTKYKTPAEEDVRAAKQYILQREAHAELLAGEVDEFLEDAARSIVTICYRYGIEPRQFVISSTYNRDMMDEIASVMDELEENILSVLERHATACTDDVKRKRVLWAWVLLLGKKGKDLRNTLEGYLSKFLKDLEAALAAMSYNGRSQTESIWLVRKYLHDIYGMPDVVASFQHKEDFAATYILSGGVQKGAVGLSNNGSTNVVNMSRITTQMTWMKEQGEDFKNRGAIGYYQLRGSDFDCPMCDDEVGFYPDLKGISEHPYVHPHCKCYRIPIFSKEQIDGLINK